MKNRRKRANRPDWLEAMLAALEPLGEITSRAMFGGHAIHQPRDGLTLKSYFEIPADVLGEPEALGTLTRELPDFGVPQ